LGRGKGYYDRFLGDLASRGMSAWYSIGVCLEAQLVPQVPFDQFDHTMGAVCTGKKLYYSSNGA
jgi:5-formyltetrahydrofolate cyclo-ligase